MSDHDAPQTSNENTHEGKLSVSRRRLLSSAGLVAAGAALGMSTAANAAKTVKYQGETITLSDGCNALDTGDSKIKLFPVTPISPDVVGMALAPDDSIWWCEAGTGRIGRLGQDGKMSHVQILDRPYGIQQIAMGHDGAFWFTNFNGDKIGRITLQGEITQFKTPGPVIDAREEFRKIEPRQGNSWFGAEMMPIASNSPMAITKGPDNAMWYTEFMGNRVGRIDMDGSFTRFTVPTPYAGPTAIRLGSDGNLWVGYWYSPKIARMTPSGKFTEFDIPKVTKEDMIAGLMSAPDGSMWFTQPRAARIGQMTMDGKLSWLELPESVGRFPLGTIIGPDNAIWFGEMAGGRVGRIAESGRGPITYIQLPKGVMPFGLVFDSKGVLWIGDKIRAQIVRVEV